jgi:hypothetical protein
MKQLKQFCRIIIRLVQEAGSIPKAIADALKKRRLQSVRDQREAERLDRICNPLKYRGK